MKEIIFITSAFPYYPGEQFIETEIMFLAEYFKKVYIVPLDGDDNIQPRPVPANVIILPEVKNFRKRSRHSGLSRFAGITRASRAIMTEACKRRSLFFSHSEAFSLMVRSASLAGQIVPILEDIFRKYDPSLIYSYWLSTGAIAACLALEKTGFDIPLVSGAIDQTFTRRPVIPLIALSSSTCFRNSMQYCQSLSRGANIWKRNIQLKQAPC